MKKARSRKRIRIGILLLTLLVLPILTAWFVLTQPSFRRNDTSPMTVPIDRLEHHVRVLSEDLVPRSHAQPDTLRQCAHYILDHFQKAGARTSMQDYEIIGMTYHNVRAFFGPESGPRLIVGAHYDAVTQTPGADDNASGVAGLIELAYLLKQAPPNGPVELVAYALEEPPHFTTPDMGSAQHVQRLKQEGVQVTAMIALEMIGYFSDKKGSQTFPMALLKLCYPSRGNFISVVGSMKQRTLVRDIKAAMRGATDLAVHSLTAPRALPGIDYSDHRSFWEAGIDAVMITDTAFYRNMAYHTPGDTADRLDYTRMAKVVIGVHQAVLSLSREHPSTALRAGRSEGRPTDPPTTLRVVWRAGLTD